MDYKIIPNKRGYYELWVDGQFIGNYDSPADAKYDLTSPNK